MPICVTTLPLCAEIALTRACDAVRFHGCYSVIVGVKVAEVAVYGHSKGKLERQKAFDSHTVLLETCLSPQQTVS